MILLGVNYQSWSASNLSSLTHIRYCDKVFKVDDFIQRKMLTFPRFRNEDNINFLFFYKFMELINFVIKRMFFY